MIGHSLTGRDRLVANDDESVDNTKKVLRIHMSIQHEKYSAIGLEPLPTIVFVLFSSIFLIPLNDLSC